MSPDRYFIKDGYRSRAEPEYFEHSGSAIAYQPDVYVEAGRGAVLLCDDVFEHLVRPETLLQKLRAALARAEGVVLSTPERDLTRGPDHFGPPPNACHVREWTIGELAALLAAEGFDHRWLGLTRSWDQTPHLHTILAFLFPDGARLC